MSLKPSNTLKQKRQNEIHGTFSAANHHRARACFGLIMVWEADKVILSGPQGSLAWLLLLWLENIYKKNKMAPRCKGEGRKLLDCHLQTRKNTNKLKYEI